MGNPANTDHPIHPLLQQRYSARAYSNQPVDTETLLSVLEAARWAPSSRNSQPWRFIVATKADPEAYQKLFDIIKPGNQPWAGNAPVLMLVVTHTGTGDDYRQIALYDAGQAVAHLTVQAQSHGLSLRQMGGIYGSAATEAYNIPEDYQVMVGIALGYPDVPESLPEQLAERERRPRTRQPLDDMVFGEWGEPAPILNTATEPAGD
ncbi:MAG: nitroreductase family protein [Chloroflexota bacterium]